MTKSAFLSKRNPNTEKKPTTRFKIEITQEVEGEIKDWKAFKKDIIEDYEITYYDTLESVKVVKL
jgi:hypothetical protein